MWLSERVEEKEMGERKWKREKGRRDEGIDEESD